MIHINSHYRIKKLLSLAGDIGLVLVASFISCWLLGRFDIFTILGSHIPLRGNILIMALAIPIYIVSGFYTQIWRYASISQYLYLLGGTIIHSVMSFLVLRINGNSQSTAYFVLLWMTSFILIVSARVAYRIIMNHRIVPYLAQIIENFDTKSSNEPPIRVMVVGAGHAGSQIIRELLELREERHIVAVIDDNVTKQHLRILGIPVVGGREMIPSAVNEYQIQEIILAIPSAPTHELREIVRICSQVPCRLRTLPRLTDLLDSKVSFSQTKDVEIEDLLGREPVTLDQSEISDYLRDQTVLVTGGGGSIGSELCRQIAKFEPRKMIIFDIYENNAYELQYELQHQFPNMPLEVLIGSVRDRNRLETVFERFRPQVVFHAAAHKHVPLMEDSPGEAVQNNVMGTLHVAQVSALFKVEKFVLISTDKAVNPTNVMGASKRIAEMIMQTMNQQTNHTLFTAVRFGNVLGSNGSVIPLFKKQIAEQRHVTVTHPDITRYFMTIPEAAGLVIQAGAQAKGGEIFVLDMGEPIKIDDLARDLIRLSGLKPDIDVKISYTGLRPGEKMFEELFLNTENLIKTEHNKIMVMQPICEIDEIRHEIEALRKIIRWDNEDFMVLRQELLNGYAQIVFIEKCQIKSHSKQDLEDLNKLRNQAKPIRLLEVEEEDIERTNIQRLQSTT